MTQTKKLLAVLDLPEEEQLQFCSEHIPFCCLADLAFRLRDEAIYLQHIEFEADNLPYGLTGQSGCWTVGKTLVAAKSDDSCAAFISLAESNCLEREHIVDQWFVKYAEPIHWIIAALIAKELADKE